MKYFELVKQKPDKLVCFPGYCKISRSNTIMVHVFFFSNDNIRLPVLDDSSRCRLGTVILQSSDEL